MKHQYITLIFSFLLVIACTRIHEEKKIALEEMGIHLMLPSNTTIEYDAPSHVGDAPRYYITYNDGNSSHSSVQVSLDKKTSLEPITLPLLREKIEQEGGVIIQEYSFANGFVGCSFKKDGNKLYYFTKKGLSNEVYSFSPNEVYNNQHKYLEIILRAIESIDFEGV